MSSTCQLSLPLPVMRWATSPSFLALQLLSHIQHEHGANQQPPFSKWSIRSICDHAGLSSWQQLSHLSPLSRPSAGPQLRLFPVWTEFATLTLLMSLKGCSLHIFFFSCSLPAWRRHTNSLALELGLQFGQTPLLASLLPWSLLGFMGSWFSICPPSTTYIHFVKVQPWQCPFPHILIVL